MKYNDNGEYKDIYIKTFDTLPVGAIVEYNGATIPSGWTDIGNNQIQKTSQYIEGGATILDAYPVGSIYMSVNSTNPATLFGGTWEQLQDTFLLAAGSTYNAGSTGGTENHRHKLPLMRHNAGGKITTSFGLITSGNQQTGDVVTSATGPSSIETLRVTGDISNATYEYQFNSMEASNMPPYLAVYVWKRTA